MGARPAIATIAAVHALEAFAAGRSTRALGHMVRVIAIVLVFTALSSIARAQEWITPECSGTTPEVNACVQLEVDEADRVLNDIYALVLKGLRGGASDPTFTYFEEKMDALVKSKRVWVKYRDAQCLAVGASYGAGTGKPAGIGQCLISLTRERVSFLKQYGQTVYFDSVLCRDHKLECAPLKPVP